jgi:hypothetical protein
MTFAKNWGEDGSGGGGYGQKYWCVSMSKSKRVASVFSGNERSVGIYPVLISKDAHIIEMPLKDADELEDHVVDLWNKGIDGVYIGGGEKELCLLNPSCAVIGKGEYHQVFGLSIKDPTDDELLVIWNNRDKGLQSANDDRNKRIEAKKQEKIEKEQKFIAAEKKFLQAVEDYKGSDKSTYSAEQAYRELSMACGPVFKVTYPYKKMLIDAAKSDYDRMTFNRL